MQHKKRFGFDDNTMNFLSGHPYPNALFEKLATKKIGGRYDFRQLF